ncbi:glycosyltransferase family 4 protein [Synechococcus sp. MU1642]|nr:glycosyltransferase family 4 protein [Synechococcus sp. MU1642]
MAPAPWTGWGIYAKQLCMALVSEGLAWPHTPFGAGKTPACGYDWSLLSRQINAASLELFGVLPPKEYDQELIYDYIFHGFGNGLNDANNLPLNGKKKVAIGFFEVANLDHDLVNYLDQFDLIVAGSTWNKNILLRHGLSRVVRVLQGVDTAVFNPIPVPRLIHASVVIFSGGKLEIRKGQDIVIQAFKKLLAICPDALLIASWCNESASLSSISMSPYVSGAPAKGDADSIGNWLESQGVPRRNFVVPGILNSAQLASLLKQADLAVFPNRCEGGTNLVAMEAIACGIPTVLSANSGHLDLMCLGCPGVLPLPSKHPLSLPLSDYENFRAWGESDPDYLLGIFVEFLESRLQLRNSHVQENFEILDALSWRFSFKTLFSVLESLSPS